MKIDVNSPLMTKLLGSIIQPSRYSGGEAGEIRKEDAFFKTAICFPDLYEIGMSNQAVRILYEKINSIDDISCERVFAPAPDFKAVLKENEIPLYTLESGIPLNELDVISFTMGTELAATSIMGVLDSGLIPVLAKDRRENDPIILLGGPAATNPLPFSTFIDAVYIGEFEEGGIPLFSQMAEIKRNGGGRKELLEFLDNTEFVWTAKSNNQPDSKKKAIRSVWQGFESDRNMDKAPLIPWFSVQDHGVIEIMRGCPNNCRFCHAGIYYNPCREKEPQAILKEAEFLVDKAGYRDITLSSLSTGDYTNLIPLTKLLSTRFQNEAVSLSLPSLRVSSFTMNILENLGSGKKSGLTFAIETPSPEWQKSINKEVSIDRVVEILTEAVSRGWRIAKFYFMVGLPGSINQNESEAIVNFIKEVKSRIKIKINVNVGTFIPKPHTAFQWAPQMEVENSWQTLKRIKDELKQLQVKVSYHEPIVSWIEGVISRGDESVGQLIYSAWQKGAYLDPWDEYFRRDIWMGVLESLSAEQKDKMINGFNVDEVLPWDSVSLRSSKKFLKEEYQASLEYRMTSDCESDCLLNCGVCGKVNHLQRPDPIDMESEEYLSLMEEAVQASKKYTALSGGLTSRLVLSYKKGSKSAWVPHRALTNLFEKLFVTSSIKLSYSQGYNPKPRIEFASPLPVGAEGENEWILVEVFNSEQEQLNPADYIKRVINQLNQHDMEGFTFTKGFLFPQVVNRKKLKLMPLVKGSLMQLNYDVTYQEIADELIQACEGTVRSLNKQSDQCELIFSVENGRANPMKLIRDLEKGEFLHLKRIQIIAGFNNKGDQFTEFGEKLKDELDSLSVQEN